MLTAGQHLDLLFDCLVSLFGSMIDDELEIIAMAYLHTTTYMYHIYILL